MNEKKRNLRKQLFFFVNAF